MGNQIAAEGADEQDMEVSEMSQHKLINNIKVNLPKIEKPLNMKEDNNSVSGGNVLNVGGSCMKEKIDNLIEGYLLNADFNSNSESEEISLKLGSKAKPTQQCSENGNLKSDVNKKTDNYSKQDEMEENILGEIQKKRNSEPSDTCSTPSDVCVKVEGSAEETSIKNDTIENLNVEEKSDVKKETKQDEESSEKVSNSDLSDRDQKKKMTTFQCLIDEVLDSSVGNKYCSSTNQTPILDLCDKMESPSESENKSQSLELDNKMDSYSTSTSGSENKTNESMEGNDKQKFCSNDDMSLSKKKVMYLKDHIEKVLERSFPGNSVKKHPTEHPDVKNESTDNVMSVKSVVQDPKSVTNIKSESKNTDNKVNVFNANIGEGHISSSNSFSTQNIVNNTMDQSKVINNLLSPSSKAVAKESTSSNILLQKSSVGTIMDSIIKNAVSETFGDGKKNSTHTKEDLRHEVHDVIRKCSSPSPPRLEKYDSRDLPHPPRLIQPDEFFTNTHEQLLKQQQQISQKSLAANFVNPHMSKKSINSSTATSKETSHYQGHISQGIGKVPNDVASGSTSSYKFQQNFVQSPKRFQQHSPSGPSMAASFKTSGVSEFHSQAHHLHPEYSPQHQVNHQISLRDCKCVACEKNTDQQIPGSNTQHGPLSSKHYEQIPKSCTSTHYPIQEAMQNTLRGSRQSPYQIPNQGRANRSNKSMEELPVNPNVSSAMALGPSPPLRYYQHNSPFRMPQLYPSNPPIPSPREYSRSNSTVNNPLGVNVHVPVPVHPQKGPDVRSPVISSTSTNMNAISPKLLRAPFPGNHPASAQTYRMDVSNPHAQHRHKQENEQNYQHPLMPHINKGMDISSSPVLDLTVKKQTDTNSSPKQSGDQPLDLTCKRPKYSEMSVKNYNVECTQGTSYPMSQDTRSNYPILQESRHYIMSKSMHINNLKHSVDKYCNEAKYPQPHKHDIAARLPSRPTSKEEYQFKSPVNHSDAYSSVVGGTGQRHPVQMYVGQGQSYHNMMSQSSVEPVSSQDKMSRPLPQSSQGHQQLSPYQQPTHQQSSPQQIARPAVSPQQIARSAVSPQQIPRSVVSPQQIVRPAVSPQQAMFPQQVISSQQRPVQSSNRQGSPELPIDPNHSRQSSRRSANVSKHEPIQNIIGNHSPNDILYLICRLCGQTYGSPYGFRKHFRNQHGFEPRAEHTIVQTISATKALRDPPVGPPYSVKATTQLHQPSTQSVTQYSENQKPGLQGSPVQNTQQQVDLLPHKPTLSNVHSTEPVAKEDDLQQSPVTGGSKSKDKTEDVQNTLHVSKFVVMDLKSGESPEEKGVKSTQEDKESKTVESPGERKYLECHECGQTFQLNDFGSYKRHCRQHVHPRIADPFNPVSENPNYQSQNLNSSRCHINYQQGTTGHKYSSQNSLPSSQESSSSTANLDPFSCKLCQVNFFSENSLKEHIYSVHSNKEKFTCLICDRGFSIYKDYQRHMSVNHHLDTPSSDAFRCPETIAAEQIDLGAKALTIEKSEEKNNSDDTNMSLVNKFRVIPSCHVTRMSADTAVTTASPDSSSDPVTSSANQVESFISSTSLKSHNSTSSITSDFGAELNKSDSLDSTGSPRTSKLSVSRQVSCDSGSTSENVEEFNETKYLHKKFGSKRKNSVHLTVENSANKYGKYGDDGKSPGNISKSPGSVNSPSANSCASFESESSNLLEINQSTDTGPNKDVKSEAVDGSEDKRIVLKIKCGSNGSTNDGNPSSGVNKGEARHQLPFVWDRVTRSQTGRPVKPPKYH